MQKAFPLADERESPANLTEVAALKQPGHSGDGGCLERRGSLTNVKLARNTWAIIGNEVVRVLLLLFA